MWQSSNRNDVAQDIEEGKAAGRYKDCVHLGLGENVNPYAMDEPFFTYCEKDSLRTPGPEPIAAPQCPKDCHFFVDRAKLELEREAAEKRAAEERARVEREKETARQRARRRALLLWPFNTVGRFFGWYAKAPWQTQVLILLVVLALVAPRLATALGELLKAALHGK